MRGACKLCAYTEQNWDYNRVEKWKVLQKSVESELNNHMESVSGKHLKMFLTVC